VRFCAAVALNSLPSDSLAPCLTHINTLLLVVLNESLPLPLPSCRYFDGHSLCPVRLLATMCVVSACLLAESTPPGTKATLRWVGVLLGYPSLALLAFAVRALRVACASGRARFLKTASIWCLLSRNSLNVFAPFLSQTMMGKVSDAWHSVKDKVSGLWGAEVTLLLLA
jgi:hypothetical protein